MRFLITVSSLTAGSGLTRYVFSLCRLLAESNEIIVATTHDNGETDYGAKELYNISPKIRLISFGTKSKLNKYLSMICLIKKCRPDVIINNYNGVVQYILPFINKNIRIIHILHNDTDDFYRIASINAKRVNGWVAPTHAIANHFNEYTRHRYEPYVKVIAHGVEQADYKECINKRLEIVYAGVLYEHKGVKILPDIVAELEKKQIDFHLTIIGGGILETWLKEKLNEQINNKVVTLTGVIDHDEVYRRMSKSDIFLYPTHLDAFGLVIAEAMMCGAIPVVTHLHGITDNLISNGVDGFLIEKDDTKNFVNVIYDLAHNGARRMALSKAAHAKAMNKFSLSAMQQNYLKYLFYKSAVQ